MWLSNMSDYQYNLGQLFMSVAVKHSKLPALKISHDNIVSFGEIEALSNKIANYLGKNGVAINNVVVIFNDKSYLSYALMIACLKIGAIYSNLDPESPTERLSKMLETCSPTAIFYTPSEISKQKIINASKENKNCLYDYSSLKVNNEIDTCDQSTPNAVNNVTGTNPAYIMFTSGSTGFPKGVLISHSSIINFIGWAKSVYNIESKDVFTNINPMHFDNSVFDFYSSLFNGAAMIPVSKELTRIPRRLLDFLNKISPTIWFSVPSMLAYVLNMRSLKMSDLPSLRIVTFGGEGFPKNLLRKLWEFWGNRVQFINVYGPTECTCICSSYIVDHNDIQSDKLLPLGTIAPNFLAYVVDTNGNVVNDNSVGELYIGGPNVGIGYYNDLEKTDEKFISSPFIKTHNEKLYKSGDLVTKNSDGIIEFIGRYDNQIKRMGYRIELEEIENALNSIPTIKECAVIYKDVENSPGEIIACINGHREEYQSFLIEHLPSYMIPDKFLYFEALPKNQNGKIDRIELKKAVII